MERVRRRLAIGLFANAGDMAAVTRRLAVLGVKHCEYLALPDDLPLADLALNHTAWTAIDADDPTRLMHGKILLRVYLDSQAAEQTVARTLLESPALSVQLHDVSP